MDNPPDSDVIYDHRIDGDGFSAGLCVHAHPGFLADVDRHTDTPVWEHPDFVAYITSVYRHLFDTMEQYRLRQETVTVTVSQGNGYLYLEDTGAHVGFCCGFVTLSTWLDDMRDVRCTTHLFIGSLRHEASIMRRVDTSSDALQDMLENPDGLPVVPYQQ